jgi:hypothetical protein
MWRVLLGSPAEIRGGEIEGGLGCVAGIYTNIYTHADYFIWM